MKFLEKRKTGVLLPRVSPPTHFSLHSKRYFTRFSFPSFRTFFFSDPNHFLFSLPYPSPQGFLYATKLDDFYCHVVDWKVRVEDLSYESSNDDMKITVWRIAVSVMRGLLGRIAWSRIDWKKLFLLCGITTILGILIPTFVFPNRLSSPVEASRLDASLQLRETVREAVADDSFVFSTAPVFSPNSTVFPSKKGRNKYSLRVNSERKKRRKREKGVDDALPAVHPPPRSPVPQRLLRYIWSLSPSAAVVYTKKEIDNSPFVTEDPYLYAPIFRNFSVFKRSYDLMEIILKVYIYPDGDKPIFHEPHLYGIYASEGWFMKFMETNRQFVTRDPEKAHLFYLPYSARQLQSAVYVRESHNLRPLSVFLRDYANMLAAKYPFWNRTRGEDHFLVACHDWGPYTLTLHEELTKNTIKALCNADVSEGIFTAGKDVSLPETTIRTPKKPLRHIGVGIRVSQRPILAFFAGNLHGRVRPILLKYWRDKDPDVRVYRLLPVRISRNMSYVQHMKSSRYCICPMGHEVNSPRIVEAIYYECVPVIIADNFVPPLNDVLDWSAFSIVVAEKDIPKLKEILLAVPLKRYLTMLYNLKMVQKHFLWNPRPLRYDLFHMILHSIWLSRVNHAQVSQS